eukprot:Gregarina_sp_Poly_1__8008@NODE_459_length_8208_cov_201_099374_g374_i0_p3_GENE_NODE_459_length_8208_cov_201_099374_g374_i0NODE_459_length_8208_cov_201_099374_g374_i0_p3_ORF_typecomplete_len255_score41_04ProkRING_4/PF14447_6/0_0022zfRING_5/PF14634_6/0_063zfRING_5/PF14634_6/1_3e02zfUDP/PF14569_6/0_072zfHIT/PF04438_16/4_2e02zfHIT/PF04438_16/7_9e03zfHIT/PF04438_16/0_062zfC3HC4/PF00097_25/0_77zfRING_6/PF14835_6/0_61HMA/PF00403_26/3_3e02HMA/PF00403_26/33HMA/PF00403_26/9_3e02zfC3HC4_3/PF13920_6/7_1IBR/P
MSIKSSSDDEDLVLLETDQVNEQEESRREFLRVNAWWRLVLTRSREFRQTVASHEGFSKLNEEEKLNAYIAFMPVQHIVDEVESVEVSSDEETPTCSLSPFVSPPAPTMMTISPPAMPPRKLARLKSESPDSDAPHAVPYYACVWDVSIDDDLRERPRTPRPITLGAPMAMGTEEKESSVWSKLSPLRSLGDELASKLHCNNCEGTIASEVGGARVFVMPCGHPLCQACQRISHVSCAKCGARFSSARAYPLFL